MLVQGDNIFYAENRENSFDPNYSAAAYRVTESLGLYLFFYTGAGLNVENSSVGREIREDFRRSKAVVVLLSKGQKISVEDNWALSKFPTAISAGTACLVYATSGLTEEEIRNLNLSVDVTIVENPEQFATVFRKDLDQLMVKK